MSEITGTTSFIANGIARGGYMSFSGSSARPVRVTRATGTVLTVRDRHCRGLEWLHARAEDWFLWPLADLKAKMRVEE